MATKSVTRKGKGRLPAAHDFRSINFGPAMTGDQADAACDELVAFQPLAREVVFTATIIPFPIKERRGDYMGRVLSRPDAREPRQVDLPPDATTEERTDQLFAWCIWANHHRR